VRSGHERKQSSDHHRQDVQRFHAPSLSCPGAARAPVENDEALSRANRRGRRSPRQ
jgi:hypothetical protein